MDKTAAAHEDAAFQRAKPTDGVFLPIILIHNSCQKRKVVTTVSYRHFHFSLYLYWCVCLDYSSIVGGGRSDLNLIFNIRTTILKLEVFLTY